MVIESNSEPKTLDNLCQNIEKVITNSKLYLGRNLEVLSTDPQISEDELVEIIHQKFTDILASNHENASNDNEVSKLVRTLSEHKSPKIKHLSQLLLSETASAQSDRTETPAFKGIELSIFIDNDNTDTLVCDIASGALKQGSPVLISLLNARELKEFHMLYPS